MINEMRKIIADKLREAFLEKGANPIIKTTTYPATATGNQELESEANKSADNGLVYIGRMTRNYGNYEAGVYEVKDPYLILIYTNNKSDDSLVNKLHDIARDTLYTFMRLVADSVSEIKNSKTGLYCGWIIARTTEDSIYMGNEYD